MPWQGPLAAFPPPQWLAPGEALLLMPLEAGAQQRTLVGIVEREGQGHLDLDDLLLRSINTYRSIAVLHQTLRELDAARSVQLSLLPRQAPQSEEYDIAGATRPLARSAATCTAIMCARAARWRSRWAMSQARACQPPC